MTFRSVLVLLLALLAACTSIPFEATPRVPVSVGLDAVQLATRSWPEEGRRYRIRQTVLFELRGARVPMTGLMDLDTMRGSARLVAVNDLGVKFFDLELDRDGETLHYLLPELARFPGFDRVVAEAVRRIFLAPRPDGDETVQRETDRYLLLDSGGGGETEYAFGGPDTRLLAIEHDGEAPWRLDFYQYRSENGVLAPAGVILQDRRAGYRLTLWLDEVNSHEP